MSLVINILELLFNKLGIYLSRGNVRVSEHFLNRMQVSAIFKQMRGKRMAQSMRRDGFFNMRFLLIRFNYLPKALT